MRHNAFGDQIRLSRRFACRFITSVIALAVATAAGCSSIDYQKLTTGEISGSLFVMWVGEGNSSGDGNFLFVPDPHDPLIFHRADPTAPGSKIKPGLMYTDGGSIPKIAQVFKGLSPWGYAPAYMIHDWIFIAHHCIVDGSTEKRFDQVRGSRVRRLRSDPRRGNQGVDLDAPGRAKRCCTQRHHTSRGKRNR